MELAEARRQIERALERMRAKYGRPVFDEWAVLGAGRPPGGGILAYAGPRPEAFRDNFFPEAEPLQRQVAGRELAPGDFEFALDASGTRHDAVMSLGVSTFLVCNATARSLDEIRAEPRWRDAQAPFVELSELFRVDPLVA